MNLEIDPKYTYFLSVISTDFLGVKGDSINERNIHKYLSRYCNKLIVVFLYPYKRNYEISKEKIPHNIVLIGIPIIDRMAHLFNLLYSFIFMILFYFIDLKYNFKVIYLRSPTLALAFSLNPFLNKKILLKYTGFIDEEIAIQYNVGSYKFIGCIFKIIENIILNNCFKIIIPSKAWINEIKIKRNIKRKLTDFIFLPACYDYNELELIQSDRLIFKKEEIIIGYIGSLRYWQGVDILVQSVSKLKNIYKIHLFIVGDGPTRKYIENMCKKNNINYKMTGYVEHKVALNYLNKLDIMVIPRRRLKNTELIFPIKLIESWFFGIPTIITKHKILVDNNIIDKKHVLYCEPEVNDLYEKLLFMIENKQIQNILKNNGPKIVKNFSCEYIIKSLIEKI